MPGVLFVSKSSTSHLEAAGQKEGACSFSFPHVSEFFMWQRFVRCPRISRRGVQAPRVPWGSVMGLSTSQVPAQRSQSGKGLLGKAAPLLCAAPRFSPTSSDAAVFAHYLPNEAAAYGVSASSAGKAAWVAAVWCRNLPVLRAGVSLLNE